MGGGVTQLPVVVALTLAKQVDVVVGESVVVLLDEVKYVSGG
jgi:hypothetical protein